MLFRNYTEWLSGTARDMDGTATNRAAARAAPPCASTRSATSARCSRRRRPSFAHLGRGRAREGDRRRWPASASGRCTGTSRGARTWSSPCCSARSTPAPTRPRRSAPRTSRRGTRDWLDRYTEFVATKRRTRHGAALGRPGVRRPARLLLGAARTRPRDAARSRDSDRRDPRRRQRQGPSDRRRAPVPSRTGRPIRVQPAHGRPAHRRLAEQRRAGAPVITPGAVRPAGRAGRPRRGTSRAVPVRLR